MRISVHSASSLLRGDRHYNPRFTQEPEYRADGASTVIGWMRPDSPEGIAAGLTLPDLPFRITIPANSDAPEYRVINTEIWRRIQNHESLWGLDFAPPPRPQQESATTSFEAASRAQ
jgi:hypothetical protein